MSLGNADQREMHPIQSLVEPAPASGGKREKKKKISLGLFSDQPAPDASHITERRLC